MFGNRATFPDKGEDIDHSQLKRLERLSRKAMLSQAKRLDPITFEHMVGALFERMGYDVRTTVASGDQGVDLYVRQGRRTAVVQCKRYRGDVGSPMIRDLYGTMQHNNADEAFMVTTGNISNQARNWAADKPIQMIDGFALVEWISTLDQRGRTRRRGWLLAGIVVAVLAVAFVFTRGGLPAGLGSLSSIDLSAIELPSVDLPSVDLPSLSQATESPAQDPASAPPTATGLATGSATDVTTPTPSDVDAVIAPTATALPADPTSSPVAPPPDEITQRLFTDRERGISFAYDSRWQAEKTEADGRVRGMNMRLTQQGYTFVIQSRDLPFAVPFCPTPTDQELERDFRRLVVNGVVMWRPDAAAGAVVRSADGTILPLPVLTAAPDARTAGIDYLCTFSAGNGYLAVSYLLPPQLTDPTQADPSLLAQMDIMLQSLRWEDTTR